MLSLWKKSDAKEVAKIKNSGELVVNLPEFTDKNVKIQNENGLISVRAEKFSRVKSTGERRHRFFSLTVESPELESAEAVFSDGRLTIKPKRKEE